MSYSLLPNQSFSIRHPVFINPVNRSPPTTVLHATQVNLGSTGTAIPASFLPGGFLFFNPVTGATGPFNLAGTGAVVPLGQVYTLPSAATILSELGEPLGASNIVPGEVLVFTAVNKGTYPAYIVGGLGTDGTFVTVTAAAPGATGAIQPVGHGQRFALEFTSVSSGSVNGNNNIGTITGSTGSYSLYAV